MKKFYTNVAVTEVPAGFSITLDERPVKTPDKQALVLPSRQLAEAVANEWRAQTEDIVPDSMPLTRMCNTTIDRVAPRREIIIRELVVYAHTDLLCYHDEEEKELFKLQQTQWQPVLIWLHDAYGISFKSTSGIIPVTQSEKAITALTKLVSQLSDYELTAFHAFVTGFGSLALGLAVIKGFKTFEESWQASTLEQTFQEQAWGTDSEVEEKRCSLKAELMETLNFWRFVKG